MVKNRLAFLFFWHNLPLVLTVFLIGMGTVSITVRFLSADKEMTSERRLNNLVALYTTVLNEADTLNLVFSTNPDVVHRLQKILDSDSWSFQESRDIRGLKNFISAPAHARPFLDSIYIFQENRNMRLLSSSGGVLSILKMDDQGWYKSYSKTDEKKVFWSEVRDIHPVTNSGGKESVITIYRTLYNGRGVRTGVIVMNLLVKELKEFYLEEMQMNGEKISIVNEEGIILLEMGSLELPGKDPDPLVFSKKLDRYDWTFNLCIEKRAITSLARKLTMFNFYFMLIALIFGLIFAARAHKKERLFLLRTLDLIETAKFGELNRKKEIAQGSLFDYMTENILQTFLEQDYLHVRKEAMEYRALQMQINPHFLFNTLETINWRAVKLLQGGNDVSRMISLLSKILKYAMDVSDDSGLPLGEELEHCGYYLQIQQIRFAGQYEVHWDIDEDLDKKELLVPRLILQPLLENCFNHGFKADGSVLHITLRAEAAEDRLSLVVEDDGAGMTEAFAGQIAIRPSHQLNVRHIGIENVMKRLHFFYKGNEVVDLDTAPGKGTKIEISVPFTRNISP